MNKERTVPLSASQNCSACGGMSTLLYGRCIACEMMTCTSCGNWWDGNAQCDCKNFEDYLEEDAYASDDTADTLDMKCWSEASDDSSASVVVSSTPVIASSKPVVSSGTTNKVNSSMRIPQKSRRVKSRTSK
jgi:hypothetical protein